MKTHTTNPQPTTLDRLLLIAIILVAIVLRVQYLLQVEFNVDQAWPIAQALDTLDRGIFPLTGQSTSVLFANPTLTGYLYLPVVALTRSALGVYVFVIALNTLAVLLAYRAVRTLIGSRLALIAAGLMAVNPWVIEYSRNTWVQSLLPFFVCAVAWLLWPVLLGRSQHPVRRTALALIMAALVSQTYLLAYAIWVPIGVLIVIFWRRVPRRGLLIGGAVMVVLTALYGVGLVTQWESVQRDVGEFSSGEARLNPEAWDHAVRLVSGADYELVRGLDAPIDDSALRHDLSRIAHVVLLGAVVIGIGLAAWGIRRGSASAYTPERDAAIIMLVWFLLPVLMMTYVGQIVHPFYQLLGLPAGYALAAWTLGVVLRPQTRVGGLITLAVALPLAVLMGLNSARYYQETAVIPGAHGLTALPLDVGLQLGAAVNNTLPPDGAAFVAVEGWILKSLAGRAFPTMRGGRQDDLTIVPVRGGAMVTAHGPDAALPGPPPGAVRAAVLELADGWRIAVDGHAPEAAGICAGGGAVDIPGEQGIALRGYALEQQGDVWTLRLIWGVTGRTAITNQRIFASFAHIFDADDTRVLIVDGPGIPGFRWRVGDCHIHRLIFPRPAGAAGPLTVRVGLYDAMHAENVIFVLPDGTYTPLIELADRVE
jgi:hypothetical protein